MKDFKLCFVDREHTAYFTTQPLSEQTGDDWNDAPYEHNAGLPYEPSVFYYSNGTSKKNSKDWNEDGSPKWEIYELKFSCAGCSLPGENSLNSIYSVDDINSKKVPWVSGQLYNENFSQPVYIYAGASVNEFKEKIKKLGGKIFIEEK
jgi:hypothetical protein